jgi:pilus assembly protein CpaB
MRRPLVFLVLAAAAAMLASLVVYSSLKKKDLEVQNALATTVPIVVAAHDIPVGGKIDSSAIKLARWPRNGLPAGAITDSGSIIGSIARAEFVDNEPIVAGRLVSPDKTSGVLPLMIPSDMRAMSVAVDEVADMSGFILPYTRVDVLLSLNGSSDKDPARSKIVLQNIPVLAVAQTLERKDSPEPERVVTLLVSPDQAERLAVASTQGKLHLALRGYGDNAVVATTGSDIRKVMGTSAAEVPEPVPVPQAPPPPPRVRIRRVISGWVHRLAPVEILRDGRSRETVPVGADGRTFASAASVAPSSGGDAPSAGSPSLGADSNGSGGGSTSGAGMDGSDSSFNSGGDSK